MYTCSRIKVIDPEIEDLEIKLKLAEGEVFDKQCEVDGIRAKLNRLKAKK